MVSPDEESLSSKLSEECKAPVRERIELELIRSQPEMVDGVVRARKYLDFLASLIDRRIEEYNVLRKIPRDERERLPHEKDRWVQYRYADVLRLLDIRANFLQTFPELAQYARPPPDVVGEPECPRARDPSTP